MAESGGLENRCVARHRGFKSHSLRPARRACKRPAEQAGSRQESEADMRQVDTHDLTAATRAKAPRPEDHVIVLFGATGDLVKRKILPGLYRLALSGLLPAR